MNVQNKYISFGCSDDCNWCVNIITVPLLSKFGSHSAKTGYLTVAVIYGCIFTACHFFCFAKTKEAVITPEKEKIYCKGTVESSHAE